MILIIKRMMKKPEVLRWKFFGVTAVFVLMASLLMETPVQAESTYPGKFDALIESIAKDYG